MTEKEWTTKSGTSMTEKEWLERKEREDGDFKRLVEIGSTAELMSWKGKSGKHYLSKGGGARGFSVLAACSIIELKTIYKGPSGESRLVSF